MKTRIKNSLATSALALAAIAAALALGSCENMPPINFAIQTPYGDASSAKDGSITIAPRPFIIPDRRGK